MADRRSAIEARLAAATPGPWHAADQGDVILLLGGDDVPLWDARFDAEDDDDAPIVLGDADADLIAHAPDDLRYLLDELDAGARAMHQLGLQYGQALDLLRESQAESDECVRRGNHHDPGLCDSINRFLARHPQEDNRG